VHPARFGETMDNTKRPVLIYDSDCALCAYQVRYWRRLTGETIDYQPYQAVAGRYPDIPPGEFTRAIQLMTPDGRRYSGAGAAFRVLAAGGSTAALGCYRYLPGCARLSEALYGFVSRHGAAAYRMARFFWGRERYPQEYHLVSWLFLRCLALIYLIAFWSFGVQATGLVGSQGILPLQVYLQELTAQYGHNAYWMFPGVFWLDAGNTALKVVAFGGAAASLLLFLNVLPRFMLPLLFLLYLSVEYAGQVFFNFQWDFLLLEAGFLAIFLPYGSPWILFLLHWVLFRLRFLSGLSKLASGDPTWAHFTALEYYFETQPLPHTGAWYANQLPDWLLRVGVGWTFFVELAVPFMMFLPRNPRLFAAWTTIVMQVLIIMTSNHNFFNLLSITLCLLLFDDRAFRWLHHGEWSAPAAWGVMPRFLRVATPLPGRFANGFAGLLALVIFSSTLSMMWSTTTGRPLPAFNEPVVRALVQWHVINNYHVFPIITTQRPELIVEGSMDGKHWKAYGFKYKPGDLKRRPPFVVPYQPRLDWQMWFAALYPPNSRVAYWFYDFMRRLLEGSPDVLALLGHNPFPDHPPKYLRARLELYKFATPELRSKTGQWWTSKPLGIYVPPVTLQDLQLSGPSP
jgi:predicted DCC family thiol-disulfide oxidoreductase YuxK